MKPNLLLYEHNKILIHACMQSQFKQILSYFYEDVIRWRFGPSNLIEKISRVAKVELEFFSRPLRATNRDSWITVHFAKGTRTNSRLW